MKLKRKIKLVLLITILAGVLFGCRFFSMENEQLVSYQEGAHTMDSQTILQSLANGNTRVFTLLTATPDATPQDTLSPVHWSQADYLQIAKAFHEMQWKEPLGNWKLRSFIFRIDGCENAPLGPQFVSFKFFKIVHTREEDSRLVHNIYIHPRQNLVEWGDAEYFPQVEQWSYLDLMKIEIPAEQALRIAESQGGQQARLTVEKDKCWILGELVAGIRNNNWEISYLSGQTTVFEINIDKQTGEYQIVPTATATK